VPPQRSEDKDYERLTQAVYQTILSKEGYRNIEVQHDVSLTGHSGTTHQVDVFWRFKQASVERSFSFKGASIIQIEEDKIRSDQCYVDRKLLDKQLEPI
jgi:hypothetical protein